MAGKSKRQKFPDCKEEFYNMLAKIVSQINKVDSINNSEMAWIKVMPNSIIHELGPLIKLIGGTCMCYSIQDSEHNGIVYPFSFIKLSVKSIDDRSLDKLNTIYLVTAEDEHFKNILKVNVSTIAIPNTLDMLVMLPDKNKKVDKNKKDVLWEIYLNGNCISCFKNRKFSWKNYLYLRYHQRGHITRIQNIDYSRPIAMSYESINIQQYSKIIQQLDSGTLF
jgi:hypothetical protein